MVHQLVRQGVVESVRGKGGGIRLARSPEEIRLGEIVRASEGPAPIVECLADEQGACRIVPTCRLAGILVEAFAALYATLDRYTLADLISDPGQLRAILVRSPALA